MEINSPKRRGRPPGTRNKPGHQAGRPSNRQCGAAQTWRDHTHPIMEPPIQPLTSTKVPYKAAGACSKAKATGSPKPRAAGSIPAPGAKSSKVPYKTPVPCTDGHNCPGNGSGGKSKTYADLPIYNPHTRDGVMPAVLQSGLNPDLPTPEQIIKEIAKIAFFDARKLPGMPQDISEEAAAVISSYSLTPLTFEGKPILGPDGKVLCKSSFNLWSKNAAQDQLNKWAGNYAKDREQGRPNLNLQQNIQVNRVDLSDFSVEDLQALLKAGLKVAEVNGSPVLDLSPELFGEGPSGITN